MKGKIKSDGGPAFPFEYHNQTSSHQESFFAGRKPIAPQGSEQYGGMTLRDWFAGMALQALVASSSAETRGEVLRGIVGGKHVSTAAYMYADAMLTEREKDL